MKKAYSSPFILIIILLACKSSNTQNTAAPITMKDTMSINGTWQLHAMPGSSVAFTTLYPRKIPVLRFDTEAKQVSGNTGCNSFSGKLLLEGSAIRFSAPMTITQMVCAGEGEKFFLENLQKVTAYTIPDNHSLNLLAGERIVMRFEKK